MWFGLDKLAIQIIGIILAICIVIGAYFWWKWGIEKAAMDKWNKQQIELVQKENKKTVEAMEKINNDKQKEIKRLQIENQTLEKRLENLEKYIASPETRKKYKDKLSSEILRRTFRELGL